jgi:hypothetical protein
MKGLLGVKSSAALMALASTKVVTIPALVIFRTSWFRESAT